jgi:hypothetical protein
VLTAPATPGALRATAAHNGMVRSFPERVVVG